MLSALIYAEEDGKRENERRVAARGCETEARAGGGGSDRGEREAKVRKRK